MPLRDTEVAQRKPQNEGYRNNLDFSSLSLYLCDSVLRGFNLILVSA